MALASILTGSGGSAQRQDRLLSVVVAASRDQARGKPHPEFPPCFVSLSRQDRESNIWKRKKIRMGIVQTFRLSHSIHASWISLLPVEPAGKSNPHQRQMGVEKVPDFALLFMKKCYLVVLKVPILQRPHGSLQSLHWLFVMIEPRP